MYTASNGAIVADLTALRSIPSTDLPASGFVVLFVASENSWFEYNPALTSGDATPVNNPANGRWLRIGRDKLTANRTYFVRTDGSDVNNGLANTSGGAFLSIQKAIDTVSSLDISIFNVTIQIASGTHAPFVLKDALGSGKIVIQGDIAVPSNVLITSSTGLFNISAINSKLFTLRGLRLTNTSNVFSVGIYVDPSSFLTIELVDFGAMSSAFMYHCFVNGGTLNVNDNCFVSGSSQSFAHSYNGGSFLSNAKTFTLSNTPNFAFAFAYVDFLGFQDWGGAVFVGASTGKNYEIKANSVLRRVSATALAGNSAGTTSTGGLYI